MKKYRLPAKAKWECHGCESDGYGGCEMRMPDGLTLRKCPLDGLTAEWVKVA